MLPQALIVCNVYVAMGHSQHADLLLRLLSNAQQGQSHSLHAVNALEMIAIVHAYADGPYDQSSFHMTGQPNPVVAVAFELKREPPKVSWQLHHVMNKKTMPLVIPLLELLITWWSCHSKKKV
jgi:hypothetical protein